MRVHDLPISLCILGLALVAACQAAPARKFAHVRMSVSDVDSDTDDEVGYTEDETEVAWGVGVGGRFGDHVGAELEYDNLGKYEWSNDTGTDVGSYRVQGVAVSGLLHYPILGKIEAFGRVGGFVWHQKSKDDGQPDNTDTGVSPLVGLGLQTTLVDSLWLRLEWMRMTDVDDYPFDQYGIGFGWNF
ncbi:MAG: outer membrane beta-barrel protein [Planctomycetota bacterium]